MHSIQKNFRYLARNIIGSYPGGNYVLRLFPHMTHRVVTNQTEIVIEGFPRSANSYLVQMFRMWNPSTIIASHIHVPAQVIRGVQLGLPIIVPIRQPVEALSSLLVADPRLSPKFAIWSYINFYEKIMPFKENFILATFQKIVEDPSLLIKMTNNIFNTDFCYSTPTPQDIQKTFSKLEEINKNEIQSPSLIAIPKSWKNNRKDQIKQHVIRDPSFSSAKNIYNIITDSFSIE